MIVRIANLGGHALVDAENLRMPDADAARMRLETSRWAGGDLTCDDPHAAVAPTLPAPEAAAATRAGAKQ